MALTKTEERATMENIADIEEATIPRGRNRNGGSRPGAVSAVSLGPGDSLSGSLTVDGDVHIEGTVEGEIRAKGDIDIEATAKARARLEGRNVTVRGQVTGDVVARSKLSVGGSGSVTGDVRAGRLRVDDGATVNGNISMGGEGKASDHQEHEQAAG
jgi:cytoskeletal protein CcmA (bactofilin family)